MSGGEQKPLVWCRFKVIVPTARPSELSETLDKGLPKVGSFAVIAIGPTDQDVRLVVEYTARGSNGHDVRKRIARFGVDQHVIDIEKVASVDVEFVKNDDLVRWLDQQSRDRSEALVVPEGSEVTETSVIATPVTIAEMVAS